MLSLPQDNHIAAAGGIKAAVSKAEAYIQEHKLRDMCIEVEVRTEDGLQFTASLPCCFSCFASFVCPVAMPSTNAVKALISHIHNM